MKRRDLLGRAAAVGAVLGVGGCVSERDGTGAGGAGAATTERKTVETGGSADAGGTVSTRTATDGRTTTRPGDEGAGTPPDPPTEATGTPDPATGTPERTTDTPGSTTGTPTRTETPRPTTETPARTETPTTTGTPTETPGGDAGAVPEVTGRRIETTDTRCGGGSEDTVSVEVGRDAVRITGRVTAPNPCYRAAFGPVTYDAGTDVLTVVVTVYRGQTRQPCRQCVAGVAYAASVGFSGGPPGEVRVEHRSDASGPAGSAR